MTQQNERYPVSASVQETEPSFDIMELLMAILPHWWQILLFTLAAVAAAAAVSIYTYEPEYRSSATLYLLQSKQQSYQQQTQAVQSDYSLSLYLAPDSITILKSRTVLERVIEKLSLRTTTSALSRALTISHPDNTRVLYVSATWNDPTVAKNIADAVCEVGAESMVSIMGIDQVNVVDSGSLPATASNSRISRWVYLTGVGAFAVAVVVFALIFLLDDKIKNPDDVERYLGLATLGTIPSQSVRKKRGADGKYYYCGEQRRGSRYERYYHRYYRKYSRQYTHADAGEKGAK